MRTRPGETVLNLQRDCADGCCAAAKLEELIAVPTPAHRLKALAAHPATRPETADRIRSSVRRHERRTRLAALAAHPGTSHAVSTRICKALGHEDPCHPCRPAPAR